MSRNRKKQSKKQKQNGQRMVLYHPPPLRDHSIKWSTRLRFNTIAAIVANPITENNIMNTVIFAATAVAGFQVFTAARIKFVELWSLPAAGVAPQTVTVSFSGVGVGDNFISSDTSMGIEPAHVKCKPRKLSAAALFFGSSANVLLALSTPAGTIIDIGIEFVYQWTTAAAATNPLVGATPGAIYLRGLDGAAAAATNYPSIGGYVNI